MGMEDQHRWFTAGEVADLARRLFIVEVPTTKSGMIKWMKRQKSADPDRQRNNPTKIFVQKLPRRNTSPSPKKGLFG